MHSPPAGSAPGAPSTGAQLQLLIESQADYAVFLLDPTGHVQTWNLGAQRLKGYQADEIIGRHFSVFYPPDDADPAHPDRVLAQALEHGHHAEESWRVRKDGTRFWASVSVTALHDEQGKLLGFGKVTRDLTARRLAEEELRATAESLTVANAQLDQFRLLVAAVRDYAIFMLDPGGHIRTWNAGAEHIKGYSADEAVGRHFSLFYTEDARRRDHPAYELEVAAREGRFEEEGWRVRKDGSLFWANVVITALRDEDGRLVGYGKVTRDLTERRSAEIQLAEAEQRARREAERQRRRASAIELVGRSIVARLDLEQIVQTSTDAATELTGAAVGVFLGLAGGADGRARLYVVSGPDREGFQEVPIPRDSDLLAPTVAGEEIVRSDDLSTDPRFSDQAALHRLTQSASGVTRLRSYLAVPVITTAGDVAGALVFGHPEAGRFDEDDEAAAVSIAASTAVAISNARLLDQAHRETAAREVALEQRDRVARVLQQSLLPPEPPVIPGLELGARYHAGTELVGGDFYDVFSLGGDSWGIVLGDVCGSGPVAAAQTALTRHSVRTAAMFDSAPESVLVALNTALVRAGADRFTTAVFARVALEQGEAAVNLASGGHPPAIICHADGTTEELHAPGQLLGVFEPVELQPTELRLRRGDLLVLYTDGLVEARSDGVQFGSARLRELITQWRDRPVAELAEDLVDAALEHVAAPVSDDIAVVVLRVPA